MVAMTGRVLGGWVLVGRLVWQDQYMDPTPNLFCKHVTNRAKLKEFKDILYVL